MSKTYTLLSTLPPASTHYGKCEQILPNQMQCWKPGAVLVRDTTEVPPAKKGDDPTTTVVEYQLCRAHALISKQAEEESPTPPTPFPPPPPLTAQLTKEQKIAALSAPPKGEDSPNNQK